MTSPKASSNWASGKQNSAVRTLQGRMIIMKIQDLKTIPQMVGQNAIEQGHEPMACWPD